MSEFTEHETLLNDVLAEETGPGGFREQLLALTLTRARRKRQGRVARRFAAATLVILLPVALWHFGLSRDGAPTRDLEAGFVRTQPLSASCIVQTRMTPAVEVVSSAPSDILVTTTSASPPLPEISDDDLLSLAAPGAVVLARRGPEAAELFIGEGVTGNP